MPDPTWRCAACGRARDEIEAERAVAGRPPLGRDALSCGQRCALALVEREIAAAREVIARADGGGRPERDGDGATLHVPRLAAYVAVMATMHGRA
jgi:hypothetical protein